MDKPKPLVDTSQPKTPEAPKPIKMLKTEDGNQQTNTPPAPEEPVNLVPETLDPVNEVILPEKLDEERDDADVAEDQKKEDEMYKLKSNIFARLRSK